MAIEFTCRVIGIAYGDSKLEYDLEIDPTDPADSPDGESWILSVELDKGKNNEDTYSALQEAVKDYLATPTIGIVTGLNTIEVQGIGKRGPRGEGKQGPRGPGGGKGDKGYKWKGRNGWVSGQSYTVDDVVTFEKATYICIKDVTPEMTGGTEEPDLNDARATDDAYRYWDQISDRPPKWRKEWTSGTVYRPGDLVWVNTKANNNKDKKTVYICVDRHQSGSGNKPTTTNVNNSGSKWEIFSDENPGDDGPGQTWRGAWESLPGNTSFAVNDLVGNEGGIYICVLAHVKGDVLEGSSVVEPDEAAAHLYGSQTWVWNEYTPENVRPHSPFDWKKAVDAGGRFRKNQLVKYNNAQWLCMSAHRTSASKKPGKETGWESQWTNYASDDAASGGTPNYRGTWVSAGVYAVMDIVNYSASGDAPAQFRCIQEHSGRTTSPDNDDAYWDPYVIVPRFRQSNWTNVNLPILVGDIVKDGKKQYYCIQKQNGTTGKKAVTNTAYWVEYGTDGTDGPTGPTGGTGTNGKNGKTQPQGFFVCDGNQNGNAIKLDNKRIADGTSAPIKKTTWLDGWWSSGMVQSDVPDDAQYVQIYLYVKMGQRSANIELWRTDQSSPPAQVKVASVLASAGSDDGTNPDAHQWNSTSMVIHRSQIHATIPMQFAVRAVGSGTNNATKWHDEARIAKAKVNLEVTASAGGRMASAEMLWDDPESQMMVTP